MLFLLKIRSSRLNYKVNLILKRVRFVKLGCSSSVKNRSVCSSSKVSLKSVGVLTPHSFTNSSGKNKRKHASSPVRRFQLLDSDSDDSDDSDDDDMFGEDIGGVNKVGPSVGPLGNHSAPFTSLEQDGKTQFDVNQRWNLWKDISPVKNISVPTPAFNDMFEEYFSSAKNMEVPRSGIGISENHNEMYRGVDSGLQQDEQIWEVTGPLPPAHCYFFNEDPRIQHLVRSRLCNFSPLGVNGVNQQQNVSHIDYMGQFDNGGASKMPGVQKGRVNGSTSRRSKSANLNVQETFNASEGWVAPKISSPLGSGTSSRKKATKRNSTKSSVSKRKSAQSILNPSNVSGNWVEPKSRTMPKDAGRRRVQASGQSAGQSTGHWFTGSDGRKVYVSKNGQEMTGRSAYIHYRKESGSGFKKSKKKTRTKKGN
ncbi:hypothetical protein KIW84_020298 [Lathyrus oleraceus]|uniref:Uncharacterized protein n=1 Tax=Pisum sativum TaxID=3888 RepID=A0A9D4YA79_PEA|nr:hypothetical protein KIW84_020298 [Pisum sativum]